VGSVYLETKYWEKTHKYGLELRKTVRQALEIDRKNGNTLWRDAISKAHCLPGGYKGFGGIPEN